MKKLTKAAALAGVLSVAAAAGSANAWWGPGYGSGLGDTFGDAFGDMFGDFNMNMSGHSHGSGRGYGRGYGYGHPYHGYYGAPYVYGPYAAAPYGVVPPSHACGSARPGSSSHPAGGTDSVNSGILTSSQARDGASSDGSGSLRSLFLLR